MGSKKKAGAEVEVLDPPVETGASQTTEGGNVDPVLAPEDEAGVGAAIDNLGAAVAADAAKAVEGVDLSEEAHLSAIERMEEAASDFTIDERSILPDVRDFLLDQIKCRPKPWSATSNAEQRDVAAACEHAAVELVRKVVEAVRSNGASQPVRCLLVGYTDKGDDIKIDLKLKTLTEDETSAAVLGLHKAKGKHVLVTVASVDDFRGDGREAELQPDHHAFDFEASGDDPDPVSDEELAAPDLAQEGDEVTIGDPDVSGVEPIRTGDTIEVEGQGSCEVGINLETSMVEAVNSAGETFDVRTATAEELAAERERRADFTD